MNLFYFQYLLEEKPKNFLIFHIIHNIPLPLNNFNIFKENIFHSKIQHIEKSKTDIIKNYCTSKRAFFQVCLLYCKILNTSKKNNNSIVLRRHKFSSLKMNQLNLSFPSHLKVILMSYNVSICSSLLIFSKYLIFFIISYFNTEIKILHVDKTFILIYKSTKNMVLLDSSVYFLLHSFEDSQNK